MTCLPLCQAAPMLKCCVILIQHVLFYLKGMAQWKVCVPRFLQARDAGSVGGSHNETYRGHTF